MRRTVRFIKNSSGGTFKEGDEGEMDEDMAKLSVKEGYVEYINEELNEKEQNEEINEENMFTLALSYWKLGWNVIPVNKDKRPLTRWKQWINREQSLKEVEDLERKWSQAVGVAGITGVVAKDRINYIAIDCDTDGKKKSEKFMKSMPRTRKHQTPSKGFHYIYISTKFCNSTDKFRQIFGIEVQGYGNYILLPGSFAKKIKDVVEKKSESSKTKTTTEKITQIKSSYKIIDSTAIKTVVNLESFIYAQAKKHGWKQSEKENFVESKILPQRILKCEEFFCENTFPEGLRHNTVGKNFAIHYFSLKSDIVKNMLLERLIKNQDSFADDDILSWKGWVTSEKQFNCSEIEKYFKSYFEDFVCDDCPALPDDSDPTLEAEVDKLTKSEDLLSDIKKYLDSIVVGEDDNKLTIFILLLGGRSKDASLISIILLKGEAGGGKTTLMSLSDMFNTKNVTRFTEHALEYSDLTNFDVLRISELGYMDVENEQHSLSSLKFLSPDDKGFTVEYTMRDPETGKLVTEQNKIPPMTVISSTTRTSLDSQLERRAFPFTPDESFLQSERIRMLKAFHEREKGKVLLGLLEETKKDHTIRVLKNFVEQMLPVKVILPFSETLTNILTSPDQNLRIRGDYDKIIALVKLYGFAKQHSLPRITVNNTDIVFVTPRLALEILKFSISPLITMTSGIDVKLRKFIEILDVRCSALPNMLSEITSNELDEIAKNDMKREPKVAQKLCDQLIQKGFMRKEQDSFDNRKNIYKLMLSPKEIQKQIMHIKIEQLESEHLDKFKKESLIYLNEVLPLWLAKNKKDGETQFDIHDIIKHFE